MTTVHIRRILAELFGDPEDRKDAAAAYLEFFAEQAAIREFDGGMDGDVAELAAWAEMPPDDGDDWLWFIDAADSRGETPSCAWRK